MNGTALVERTLPGSATAEVIGELRLLETRYAVIVLPDERGDASHSDSLRAISPPGEGEIVRFEVAGRVCSIVAEAKSASHAGQHYDPGDILTKRELQIAGLVASGRINKQIAADLQISEWTVSSHLRRIYAKLGIRTRAALAFRCASLVNSAPSRERPVRY